MRQALLYSQNSSVRRISVDDRSTVSIFGHRFQLSNPHDFVLASTIIESWLRDRYYRGDFEAWFNVQKIISENSTHVEFIESDAPPFYNPRELAILLQTVRILKDAGKIVPAKVQFVRDGSTAAQRTDVVYLKFNGTSYNPAIGDLASYYLGKIPFPGNDFVGTFEEFFLDGVGFRKKIDYAKITGRFTEYQTMQANYQALRNWAGVDISVRGKVKLVQDYKVGQTVSIADYEQDWGKGGIYLRAYPTLEKNSDWPLIFNKGQVTLLGSPRVILDHQKREAITMWPVEAGNDDLILHTKEDLYNPQPKRGWISEEWFGAVVK